MVTDDIYQCENTDRTNGGTLHLFFLRIFWESILVMNLSLDENISI